MISELVVPQLDVQFASALIDLICIRQMSAQTSAMQSLKQRSNYSACSVCHLHGTLSNALAQL